MTDSLRWSHIRVGYFAASRYLSMMARKAYALKSQSSEDKGMIWNAQIIMSAAGRLNITAKKLTRGFIELSYQGRTSYCHGSDFEFENLIAWRICGDKQLTSSILSQNGISVPEFGSFSYKDYPLAADFFHRLPKPVVVKPQLGTHGGIGVTTGVDTLKNFERAFALALVHGRRVLVERFVTGQNYRILMLEGEVLSVVKRIPAHIVGDGVSTVRQLIEKNDAELPVASEEVLDNDSQLYLRNKHVDLKGIPRCDEVVYLKQVCNYHGWPNQIQEVTNDVHPEFIQLASKINELIRAKLCGVDIITTDISKPTSQVDYVVNEINTTVALYIAYEPIAPDKFPDDVGLKILKYLFAI